MEGNYTGHAIEESLEEGRNGSGRNTSGGRASAVSGKGAGEELRHPRSFILGDVFIMDWS